MTDFKAITTVYSYYLPEIRDLITRLTRDYPHDVFLRSISPGLDDFHHPIIDKLISAHRHDVPQLEQFAHRYPTSGSEEGIREYVTLLQSEGVEKIYVWKGEYEGYREVAKTRGVGVVELDVRTDPATLPRGHWFLSNPSARDGMIVPSDRIRAICDAGHQVFYDLSYLGTTEPTIYDLAHPNIAAAVVSFSKPFGLFYYRIGFTFARTAIPVLYANKWFKNVFGLLIADRLLAEMDQAQLTHKYKLIQAEIVREINEKFGLGLSASDAFILAKLSADDATHLADDRRQLLLRFRRADGYRFCLTPYLQEHEARGSFTASPGASVSPGRQPHDGSSKCNV
jgi:histidinol-phosphate/aromatic aminotransferase/cobyric acid decarboxylase-like protein